MKNSTSTGLEPAIFRRVAEASTNYATAWLCQQKFYNININFINASMITISTGGLTDSE
jgi:hypothetical protein